MHKQRNAVDKSFLEFTDNIKTLLAQRIYSTLSEAKVERQIIVKVVALVSTSVDEVYGRQSKHFEKNVDNLVKAVETALAGKKSNSKSRSA